MVVKLNNNDIVDFHENLFNWWRTNKRELPWRIIDPDPNPLVNPYHILVSEFMLQQTQVVRVVPKYFAWIKQFPTLKILSQAKNSEVLQFWSGLGYNRRALWLRDAAKELLKYDSFPKNPSNLIKIKGIGKYSSHAIPIFAFNEDLATVDVNISRVLIHLGFAPKNASQKELFELAKQMVPKGNSRNYHSALLDYGALEVTAKKTGIRAKLQPAFKGSQRKIRGEILKILINNQKLNRLQIVKSINNPNSQDIDKILLKMQSDGLISVKNGYYSI